MMVLGITGSVGMGKTLAAAMLSRMGIQLHCSDNAVHGLLGPKGSAVAAVAAAFPSAFIGKKKSINRARLGQIVFRDDRKRRMLESILHPLVRVSQRRFMAAQRRMGARVIALDIPLLFETRAERLMDYTIVTSAPAFIQRRRVLARPGMDEARFKAILQRQMSDGEKRRRADFTVATGLGRAHTFRQLKILLARIQKTPQKAAK